MNDINNDQLMLFDTRKKLNLTGCPDTSLDGIGSDLLGQDFLKVSDDNAMSRNDRVLPTSSDFADQLLIINNDLSDQQPITLDDVVDLDLTSLSHTLENSGIGQQLPQEPLGFTDFLSESSFCLNGLSEKLDEVPDKLSFGSFISNSAGDDVLKSCGKGYKIVSHYVDGKITNTIHLTPIHAESEDTLANGDIASKIFQQAAAPLPASSSSDRITASIDDFPSIATLSSAIPLDRGLPTIVETNGFDPEISDLITVKPKEPVNKSNDPKAKPKENKSTKRKLKNESKPVPVNKQKKKKKKAQPNLDSVESANPIRNVIPKFKIVQKPNDVGPPATPSELSLKPQTPSTQFVAIPTSSFIQTAGAERVNIVESLAANASSSQEPIELILPVVSVPGKGNSKPVLKPISELQPEDVCTVRRDPLKKLSKIQLQQIVNFLRQRKVMKSSPSNLEKNGRSKIVCRIMYPDEFQKKCENDKSSKTPKEDSSSKKADESSFKKDEEPQKPKKSKVRVQDVQEEEYVPQLQIAPSVTRSGRTSRPPKQLLKLNLKSAPANGKMDETSDPSKESGRTGADDNEELEKLKPVLLSLPPKEKKKVNNFVVCPTCGKKYIGRISFQRHLEQFPGHAGKDSSTSAQFEVEGDSTKSDVKPVVRMKRTCKCKCKVPTHCRARRFSLKQMVDSADDKEFVKACAARFAKSTSVWDFIVMRVKTIFKFEEYIKGLIGELGKLVDALRSASNKILYPSDQPCENSVEIQDDTISYIMGVTKGTYQTYPSGLEMSKPSDQPDLFFEKESVPNMPTDFDMVHPDAKEDISQSSLLSDILCDKSGMESVDQLVSERLKTLAPGDDILMDPPSDDLMTSLLNSVHSGSLSNSMFNPPVSGSTEDLLKALETLSNETQPNPPPLDFSALSTEFSTHDR